MAGMAFIWMAGGALGGALATGLSHKGVYAVLGGALLGAVAGLLGGGIVALFDGIATPGVALGSVAMALLAGLLQMLTLRLLNDGRRPARW
ncbi:MAG: hypothetical protein ACRDHP_10330 [Ktedonobacterales bacterium]